VADDDDDRLGRQGAGRAEHTFQQRPARDPVKNLGSA
jgi:hypothetical protein